MIRQHPRDLAGDPLIFIHHLRGIFERRRDAVAFQFGVTDEEFLDAVAAGDHSRDVADLDSSAADVWFTAADGRGPSTALVAGNGWERLTVAPAAK